MKRCSFITFHPVYDNSVFRDGDLPMCLCRLHPQKCLQSSGLWQKCPISQNIQFSPSSFHYRFDFPLSNDSRTSCLICQDFCQGVSNSCFLSLLDFHLCLTLRVLSCMLSDRSLWTEASVPIPKII